MKRILLLFLFLAAIIYNSTAQKDYASLYFFVPKKLTVLPATIHVSINGVEVAELKKGASLEYREKTPKHTKIKKSPTTEKIKILSNYVVLIKIR